MSCVPVLYTVLWCLDITHTPKNVSYARFIKHDCLVLRSQVLSLTINGCEICLEVTVWFLMTLLPLLVNWCCYYERAGVGRAGLLWLTCHSCGHSQVRRLSRSYTTGCSLSPAGSGSPSLRRTMEWPSSASLTIQPWRTSRPRNTWKCSVSHLKMERKLSTVKLPCFNFPTCMRGQFEWRCKERRNLLLHN